MAETIETPHFLKEFMDSDNEGPGKTFKVVINDEVGEVGSRVFKTTDRFPLLIFMRRNAMIPAKGHALWVESKGWTKLRIAGKKSALTVTAGDLLTITSIPEKLL